MFKHHLAGSFLALLALVSSARGGDAAPDFRWFDETRAGMFIHWGPYSIAAGEWKGKRGKRDAHLQQEFRIPAAEYKTLVDGFNPTRFNADAWVKLAKDAGLGYVVYVSKHHDGFAMFDSPSNPYNMVDATPFKRDPLREIADACKKQGIVLCVYYSFGRDWAEPGIPTGGHRCNDWDFPDPPATAQRDYIQNKVKPQLRELLTQYGPLGAVWFDTPDQITPEHSEEIRAHIRSLQPHVLINARIGNGKGDYDIHEQKIPEKSIHRPWEACLTLNNRWGYDRNDHNWKSPAMVVRCLVDVAGKGGNFLINIGPTGEGQVPAPSVDRLHSLGEWMRVNGESIRGASASLLSPEGGGGMTFQEINADGSEKSLNADGSAKSHNVSLPRGWRSTTKSGALYIHLFDQPENGVVRLSKIPRNVTKVTMLADDQSRPLKFHQASDGSFTATLLPGLWDERATVLKLETAAAR